MQTIETNKATSQTEQYFTFLLGGEEYAINILKVKEIIEFNTVTTVPNTPPWVRGVLNLRGQVVPVIDLAVKFGLRPTVHTKLTCTVVVEIESNGETRTFGVIAEEVCQVIDLSAEAIEPTPSFGTRVKIDFLQGMGRIDQKFCLILNIDKVLSTDELLAAENTTSPSADGELSTPAVLA